MATSSVSYTQESSRFSPRPRQARIAAHSPAFAVQGGWRCVRVRRRGLRVVSWRQLSFTVDATGRGEVWLRRTSSSLKHTSCVRSLNGSAENILNQFVQLLERTVQLCIATLTTAYTDFAASYKCSSRSYPRKPAGDLRGGEGMSATATQPDTELSPQKASFLYRITSRWRISGGTFLVEQRRSGQRAEIQRDFARIADDSVPA